MSDIIKNLNIGAKGIWLPLIMACTLLVYIIFMQKKAVSWQGIYITIGVIGLREEPSIKQQ